MISINLKTVFPSVAVFCLLAANPLLLFIAPAPQSDLKYQDRGDRYEGIRGSPVSDGVELISALVDYQDAPYANTPDQFKLRVYLPGQADVSVTVREINTRENYWLDRIRPAGGWRSGVNEFSWSTNEVIKRLNNLKLSDLGAVAQLEGNQQSPDMKVAPAILFYSSVPQKVSGYTFAFRISRKADVTCTISKDETDAATLYTKSITGMLGNLPRATTWNTANAPEGWYRLRINVVYRNDGKEINQFVHFYHRPTL